QRGPPSPRSRRRDGFPPIRDREDARRTANLLSVSIGLSRPRLCRPPNDPSAGRSCWKGPAGIQGRQAARRTRRVLARHPSLQLLLEGKESDARAAPGLILTVNRLYAEGIQHFAMVHDSFGVHAADVDLLNRILREEFVRIYSEPVLQNFLNEQRKAHPNVDLPEPPQTGTLDISQVISSPYFFA